MRRVRIKLCNGKCDDLSQEEALNINLEERYGPVIIEDIEFYNTEEVKEDG